MSDNNRTVRIIVQNEGGDPLRIQNGVSRFNAFMAGLGIGTLLHIIHLFSGVWI